MSSLLSRSGWSQGAQLVAGLYCAGLTHLGEAGLYAVGFPLEKASESADLRASVERYP